MGRAPTLIGPSKLNGIAEISRKSEPILPRKSKSKLGGLN
ncbi:uncharacterized protein G2W53_012412 [Senna tora]|uniref:Uncharacterized protein n=1 Tax=Senna tora TaxID=362788 RepID=A0A834TY18_9FABA|nr:uncharacterized protein G2W53_012412 [Senna tora]